MKTAVNSDLGIQPISETKKQSNIETKAYIKALRNKNYLRGDIMSNSNNDCLEKHEDFEHSNTKLADLNDIQTDPQLPISQKMIHYVEQIQNPYLFKVGDITVKVNFAEDGPSFQDKFLSYLKCSATK